MTPLSREDMARRVARALPVGGYVNLGIGIPSLVAKHIPPERDVTLHSENGILRFAAAPAGAPHDRDLIDATKKQVVMLEGGSYFDSALSFALMRGGHLDVAVLGGFEVSRSGDLANWATGLPDDIPSVGGAMDLACGAKEIWILMEHTTRDGRPKLVEACSYPLTAKGVVTRVFTDLAIIAITPDGPVVEEMVEGLDLAALQARTGAALSAASQVQRLAA